MTILESVRDGALFARWFESPSWRRWFVVLAALFALPIESLESFGLTPDEALEIFRHHTGRETWPTKPAVEFWGLMGRRGGKSRVMALVAVFLACFKQYTLAPGERGVVMLLAADKKQARVLRRYIGAFLDLTPLLDVMVTRRTTETIDLSNGTSIEVHVASYRTTRGFTCVAVVCDEICFWRTDDESANPDSEVLNALRPSMATIPGALLMAISSPYAKRGEAWDTFKRYWGVDQSDVLVWRATTREMNPAVRESVIERAYEKDHTSARSEYGAEWRDDISTFLDRAQLEALVEAGATVRPCRHGVKYFAHCDPSGGRSDSMTLAIGHQEGDTVLLDYLAERRPPFNPDDVVAEFAGALKHYGVNVLQIDGYAAEWVPSAFARVGITAELPKKMAGTTKANAAITTTDHYRAMLPLVTTGNLSLLDHKRLINQLSALERRVTPGGKEQITHPPGSHDDLAASVAGMASQAVRKLTIQAGFAHVEWLM